LEDRGNGELLVRSQGAAEFVVPLRDWDPEQRHRLHLWIRKAGKGDARIEVHFRSDLPFDCEPSYWLLSTNGCELLYLDLLRLPLFALASRISEVSVSFKTPGDYYLGNFGLE
jgi:hypothetical protein